MNCFSSTYFRQSQRAAQSCAAASPSRTRRLALCCALVLGTAAMNATARDENAGQWYSEANSELQKTLQLKPNEGRAKNVILFVGDGMGLSTVTAARIFDGQLRGDSGEENSLAFEELPYMALAKTYNTDQQIPDSAGTATAIMSGVKTKSGVIGVNQNVQRGDCKSAQGNTVQTILEFAAKAGLGTGIVTTSSVTDATAAAAYAHTPERGWQSDRDMPTPSKIAGCKDIARQLIEFPLGGGLDVVLGGGRGKFLPSSVADPEGGAMGEREDRRDLTVEWSKRLHNAAYVWNQQQFTAIDPKKTDHLLGLFNRAEMSFEADRKTDVGGEPSLPEMTKKAIAILKKNPRGFFLLVEGGRIDHAHHTGNAYRALDETREFSNAVRAALAATDMKDTLIIVTADHGHVLTMGGVAKRGNPILGKAAAGVDENGKPSDSPQLALDGRPYTTLGYMNGPGAIAVRNAASAERERRDIGNIDTAKPDYLQQALVPLSKESHSGEDVPVYAGGPWAQLFHRTVEQNYIFHVMRHALSVPDKTPAAKSKPKAKPATKE